MPVEVHGQVRRGDEDDFARRVASVLQGWGVIDREAVNGESGRRGRREAREAERRAKMIVISNRCVELKESVNVVNA